MRPCQSEMYKTIDRLKVPLSIFCVWLLDTELSSVLFSQVEQSVSIDFFYFW